MDAARRRTLVPDGPMGNGQAYSSIPLPSSAMKKGPMRMPSNSRLSMAPSQPGHSRLSVMPGPSSQPALSHSSSQDQLRNSGMGPLRGETHSVGLPSGSRGDGGMYGRASTSQPSRNPPGSVRRSSVFPGGGRASVAPGMMLQHSKQDTRPLRDRKFQLDCMNTVQEYLLESHYPVAITAKTFTSPTQKEFVQMFRYLIDEFIDPVAFEQFKKPEDAAIAILKDLRYPGMDSCGKTAWGAPGSPAHYPGMLAMLCWLVELKRAHERWVDPECITDPMILPAKMLPIDHPQKEDREFWDYARITYGQWYNEGYEEFQEADDAFTDVYEQIAQASFEECEKLETEFRKLNAELKDLQSQEPPLKALENQHIDYMSDKAKFVTFITSQRAKSEKLRLANERARALISDQEQDVIAKRAELARIEKAVAEQNLSPDEVQRMNHERESLKRNLDDLRTKVAEVSQQSYNQELMVTKMIDLFEQLLSEYTSLGHQIGIIQPLADGETSLGPDGVDYNIQIDMGTEDILHVQTSGQRMSEVIKPALQAYSESFRRQVSELANEQISLEDDLDKVGQRVDGLRADCDNLEVKLKLASDQAELARRQLESETNDTNRQIGSMEERVITMSNESQQEVTTLQSTLEQKRVDFEEFKHKTARLQEDMVQQVMEHMRIIFKMKEHTANHFKSIRALAESH